MGTRRARELLDETENAWDDAVDDGRETSTTVRVLAVVGLLALGSILIPALYGLISALPDLRRYLRIQRM